MRVERFYSETDVFEDAAQLNRDTLSRTEISLNKMKTDTFWLYCFERTGSSFIQSTTNSDSPLTTSASVWPKLSSDTLTWTLWEQGDASWTEGGVEGSEVIFWPLCPPWSSKSLAPCRQMHLRSSRDLPLKTHMNEVQELYYLNWTPEHKAKVAQFTLTVYVNTDKCRDVGHQ